MNDISIEDKIKVLEQLYVKEKDEENKLLILYQIKKYRGYQMLDQNYKEILINNINIFCKNINCSNCGGTYNFQTFTCEFCNS